MKKIRLAVAQRYLRRYTGAQIECAYREGETPERDFDPPLFVGYKFTPKAKVFLMRDDTRIAQITEGLPSVSGHLEPFTAEFLQDIPY